MKSGYHTESDSAYVSVGYGERKRSRTKCCVITAIVVLILAVIIAVVVYFAAFHNKEAETSPQKDGGAGTTVPVTTGPTTTVTPTPPDELRTDCQPDKASKDKDLCTARGCQWDEKATIDSDKCYFVLESDTGITTGEIEEITPTEHKVNLYWAGEKKSLFSNKEDIIENVALEINQLSKETLRLKFKDADQERYEVPIPLNLKMATTATEATPMSSNYEVKLSGKGEKFTVKVTRTSDSTVIFDTSVGYIVMEKQYLSLSTRAPTKNVYGFGEHVHNTFKHQFNKSEVWGAFARDQPPSRNAVVHYENLYGVHPFYVCIEDSGKAHGVFMLNSNTQDYELTPSRMITFRTIGGILDFFIFTGPTPENVIQQYTQLIGRPYMPPYWALGFQLCRYGYNNTDHIRAAVERTRDAMIPHDVQYADIDYMEARKDFTIDEENFGDLPEYFEELRTNYSMKTIIILDPALSIQDGYEIYTEGKEADIYIKWPTDIEDYNVCDDCQDENGNMYGYVWPDNRTVFPDFFKTRTQKQWKTWIFNQSVDLGFDGLWIDMNEPANFDTNKDKPWNWPDQRPNEPFWNLKCDMNNSYENPPYKTKSCYVYDEMNCNVSDKTICMVGKQGENDEYLHYDVHNLYGWSQSEPTLKALREVTSKRGMVISRSTFPGSGRYIGHWLGDNSAIWQHLRDSIVGMLEFNLFGIPYVGADICGFFLDTTAELCKRWMQLGAFYPFSRNHNTIYMKDHDPGAFEDRSVAELSRTSLETRYKLLPYLYTLFYHANTKGNTVVRSLQFEWPTDPQVLDISEQFLWGDAILFSPILYEGQTKLDFYLPSAIWYDYYEDKKVSSGNERKMMDIDGNTEIPIHIRGGKIIPMKDSRLTTTHSRQTPFTLLVALDMNETAVGDLYWDDGEAIDPTTTSCYVLFKVGAQQLNSTVTKNGCQSDVSGDNSLTLKTIKVLGVETTPVSVTLAERDLSFDHNDTTKLLQINDINININSEFTVEWN